MFEFRTGERVTTSLLIGFAGASGAGKTMTAILTGLGLAYPDMTPDEILATIAKEGRSRLAVIDTESGRALHYSPKAGEKPDFKSSFPFDYTELRAPFTPDAYREAIAAADDAGYPVIIVDSTSHVWEGEGGVLEQADKLAAGVPKPGIENPQAYRREDWLIRPLTPPAQWIAPKSSHKKFVSRLIQCRAHVILCFRAAEKMKLVQKEGQNGKKYTEVIAAADRPVEERWEPICDRKLPYEMTASFLLLPSDPGVGIPWKLQEQHRMAFPPGERIGVKSGWALAHWATGALPSPPPSKSDSQKPTDSATDNNRLGTTGQRQPDLLGDKPDDAAMKRTEWVTTYLRKVDDCRSLDALTELQDRHQSALTKMKADPEQFQRIVDGHSDAYNRLNEDDAP